MDAVKRLEDYSLIVVKRVEQFEIPSHVSFFYQDADIYVGPNSSSSVHKRVPNAVVDFFRANAKKTVFEHAGWEWAIRGYADAGFYTRTQDRRGIIFDKITPYVSRLKSFEKKKVAFNEVLPPFEKNCYRDSAFDIADTGFHLVLNERAGLVKIVVAELDVGFGVLRDVAAIASFEYEGSI